MVGPWAQPESLQRFLLMATAPAAPIETAPASAECPLSRPEDTTGNGPSTSTLVRARGAWRVDVSSIPILSSGQSAPLSRLFSVPTRVGFFRYPPGSLGFLVSYITTADSGQANNLGHPLVQVFSRLKKKGGAIFSVSIHRLRGVPHIG